MALTIISIDLNQLDPKWYKEMTLKSGKAACFVDLVLIETPKSQYSDYMVVQGLPKEDREAGEQGPIVGNGKIIETRGAGQGARPARPAPQRAYGRPQETRQDRGGGMDQTQRRRREAPPARYGRQEPPAPESEYPRDPIDDGDEIHF